MIGNKAPIERIYIEQGSDWEYVFRLTFEGDAIDLTGCSLRGQIRKTALSEDVVASFTFEITDATDGKAVAKLANTTTTLILAGESESASESQYVYDWELVDSSSRVMRIMQGDCTISRGVTR